MVAATLLINGLARVRCFLTIESAIISEVEKLAATLNYPNIELF